MHFCHKKERKKKPNAKTSNLPKHACLWPWLISITQWFGTERHLTLLRLITVAFWLVVILHVRALKYISYSRCCHTDGILLFADFLFFDAGLRTPGMTRVTLEFLFEKKDRKKWESRSQLFTYETTSTSSPGSLLCLRAVREPSSTALRLPDTNEI